MRSYGLFAAALTLSFFVAGSAAGHITITEPPDRDGNQKTGPCEGEARGSSPKAYTGGEVISVKWTETVEHGGGFFRISLDTNGDTFDTDGDGKPDHPKSKGNAGGSGDESLKLLDIPDRNTKADGMRDYSAEVTLPNIDCDQCTLQVIQMMGDKEPSDRRPTNHIYFRCADITITKNGNAPAGGAGGMPAAGAGGMPAAGAGGMPAAGAGGMPAAGAGGMPAAGAGGMPAAGTGGAAPGGAGGMPTAGGSAGASTKPVVPTTPSPPGSATGGTATVPSSEDVAPPRGGTPGATPAMGGETSNASGTSSSDDGGCAVAPATTDRPDAGWSFALLGFVLAWRRRHDA